MPVTERLMAAGSWDLALDPGTPASVRSLLDFFGHIFIFDVPQRPFQSDAALIAASRWGGVLRRKQTPFALSGGNMISWLGDENGNGSVLTGALTTPNSFVGYINGALATCIAIQAGTLTAIGANKTITYNHMTARQVIDHLCTIYVAEYRVNKNGTIDAGPQATVFPTATSPTAIAVKRSSGRDLSITGIPVTKLDVEVDAEDYINRAIVHDTTGAYTGNLVADSYVDLFGNAMKAWKIYEEPNTPNAEAATQAANLVTAGQVLRNSITLTSDEFDLPRDVAAGDFIWVYDEDGAIRDNTNQLHYRGSLLFPMLLRVFAVTWPIEKGMSIWYRDKAAVWTDLTNYVVFEQPGASLEVGAKNRPLLTG